MEWELSDKIESRSYCHDFVKRLQTAKAKGFKFTGTIREAELRAFETGQTKPEKRDMQVVELTPENHERIRLKNLRLIEESGRDARLTKMAKESLHQKKLDKFHIMPGTKENTNIFL